MKKRRNPLIASVLALIPGLGQLYNGNIIKAGIYLVIDILVPITMGFLGLLKNFEGLIIIIVFFISFVIYRIIDAYQSAKRQENYVLKRYNRWFIYLAYFLALVVFRVFVNVPVSTGIQTFHMPNSSMYPTIQPDDLIATEVNRYNGHTPKRGDIVTFNSPENGIFIFRVVGLPQEYIEVKEGKVYINDKICELTPSDTVLVDDVQATIFQEKLLNTYISTVRYNQAPNFYETRTFEKIQIPEKEYFLMGDNRDNAFDSKFIGTINQEDILGQVIYSYWGKSSERIKVDFRKK